MISTLSVGRATNRLVFAPLLVTLALGFAGTLSAAYVVQPADKHSFLIQRDGKGIRDDDFANMISKVLIKNGQSNVKDAKFLFQSCFGGGMLDDLDTKLGMTVKWVGGSGSRWDQPAIGKLTPAENNARPGMGKAKYDAKWEAAKPFSLWTESLAPALDASTTVLSSLNTAEMNDIVGPNGMAPYGHYDDPQTLTRNGGENIKLKDNAQSYHAIIWAGDPDAMRHFNNTEAIFNKLLAAWGNPDIGPNNITIDVFFGDGAMKPGGGALPSNWHAREATRANLESTLNGLDLNPNEQFLFYATDHGGDSTTIQAPVPVVPMRPVTPMMRDDEPFKLFPNELFGVANDDVNDSLVNIQIQGTVPDNTVQVLLNGTPLGFLSMSASASSPYLAGPDDLAPGSWQESFAVPDSLLSTDNTLSLINGSLSTFFITGKSFFSGAINDSPRAVPEAATWMLASIGTLVMLGRGSRQPRRQ